MVSNCSRSAHSYILGVLRVRHNRMAAVSLILLSLLTTLWLLWLLLYLKYSKLLPSPGSLHFLLPLSGISLFPCLFPFLQLTSSPKFFLVHSFQRNLHSQPFWSLSQLPLPRQQEPCLCGSLCLSC